jgi:DNA ligase-4
VQIKAAQLVPSEKYKVGFTLRFPRVVKFRLDKDWNECMKAEELILLANQFGGRYARRKYGDVEHKDPSQKKRKITSRKATTVLSHFLPADTSAVEVNTTIFGGKELCIMNGDEEKSKREIELLVHENGGTIVQYPTDQTKVVIAAKRGNENLIDIR